MKRKNADGPVYSADGYGADFETVARVRVSFWRRVWQCLVK